MKLVFLMLILLPIELLSQEANLACDNYRQGKFIVIEGVSTNKVLIKRKKKKQIEISEYEGRVVKIISKIVWEANNRYSLTTLKEKNLNIDSEYSDIGNTAYVTITKCENDIHICSYKQGDISGQIKLKKIR